MFWDWRRCNFHCVEGFITCTLQSLLGRYSMTFSIPSHPTPFFLIPTLKEFKTSTNICQSYSKNKSGPVFLTHSVHAVRPNNEGVFMGPTHILQLYMGPSYFWRGLTHPDPPLFRTLLTCTLQSLLGRYSITISIPPTPCYFMTHIFKKLGYGPPVPLVAPPVNICD